MNSNQKFQAFISNIDYQVTEEQLRDFFRENNPTVVKIPKKHGTENQNRGYGFIDFSNQIALNNALEVILLSYNFILYL